MRRLGRVLLNKSSPEKNRLQGCFGFLLVVYALLPGQGGIFFPFIKSRWWNSCVKNVPPCTRRTVTFVTSWINSWNPENVTQRILYKQTSLQSLLDLSAGSVWYVHESASCRPSWYNFTWSFLLFIFTFYNMWYSIE